MAYGKSRNAKKTDLGLFILELLAKIKKNGKNWHFWRVFDKKHNYEKKKWRNGLLSICGLSA